jgi:hypothetical protein
LTKNPITSPPSYVINDSPNGIDLSYSTIQGNLYGIESKIIGSADFHRIRVMGNTNLTGMVIKDENDPMCSLNMEYGEFYGNVNLDKINVFSLVLNHAVFHQELSIKSLKKIIESTYVDETKSDIAADYIVSGPINAKNIYADFGLNESRVNGDVQLNNSIGEEAEIRHSRISGTLDLEEASFCRLFLNNTHFNNINFKRADTAYLQLMNTKIDNCSNFDNLKVEAYTINQGTCIPNELMKYLEQNSIKIGEFDERP